MFRIFALAILLCSSVLNAHSQSAAKEIISHGNAFRLSRQITVVSDKAESSTAEEVVKILDNAGFFAKTSRRLTASAGAIIQIERTKAIEGVKEPDALQIKVTADRVTLRYTNNVSKTKALEYLEGLISDSKIQGYDIKDWTGAVKVRGNEIDVSDKYLGIAEIEEKIRNAKKQEVYVRFVSTSSWRLESTVFTLVNPKESIYPAGGYYKMSQIKGMIDKFSKSKVTVIPVIELLNPNDSFEKVTGHKQYSVEGMRFVRAVIEEYAAKLGCKKICIGNKSNKVDERYIQFINDIAHRCGVELIIK